MTRKEQLKLYLKHNCHGRERIMTSAELEGALRMSGNELRKHVNRLRQEGVPIASDRTGYFYAATAGEVYSTIRILRKMADGLNKAIAGLEAALEQFGGGAWQD